MMVALYLVVMVAVNTKYSINTAFPPDPVDCGEQKSTHVIDQKRPHTFFCFCPRHVHGMEPTSKTFRSSRRRNMEFINLGSPLPVKGLDMTKIYTQYVVALPVENGERG
jgi:hypothetical protein